VVHAAERNRLDWIPTVLASAASSVVQGGVGLPEEEGRAGHGTLRSRYGPAGLAASF
jgi:hypothetical protein